MGDQEMRQWRMKKMCVDWPRSKSGWRKPTRRANSGAGQNGHNYIVGDRYMCQSCGEWLGDGDGYPVTCEGCKKDQQQKEKRRKKR